MRITNGIALALMLAASSVAGKAGASSPACFGREDAGRRFLLQTNYSETLGSSHDFRTSRSRVVRLERSGASLELVDHLTAVPDAARVVGAFAILGESERGFVIDFDSAFDRIYTDEDRTGEDYYGRIAKTDDHAFRLFDTHAVSVVCRASSLFMDVEARKEDGSRLLIHYYLEPYRPDPKFLPFEMRSLEHYGLYETYPRRQADGWVLYAMKFASDEPIEFAISETIPARYRAGVRDGVEYWNRVLGRTLLRVIDAPSSVRAPSHDYNVIEWVSSGAYASTSYIQADPLTGQILHAHVFVLRETMMEGDVAQQNDHLRYIVAHEIGHALGLRHNFAPRGIATVMDYFNTAQIMKIGRGIRERKPALPYDREVMRHVYFGDPLDVATLPPFCTDSQKGCSSFPMKPPLERLGSKADSTGGD